MPRPFAGGQYFHRRLLEQIALKTLGVAVARPALEADERRARARPQSRVLEVRKLHRDRRARRVHKGERAARAIEKTDRVVGEKFVVQRQVAPLEGHGFFRLADESAGRDQGRLRALLAREADEGALPALISERPANAWMEAAGVRRAPVAWVRNLERHAERILAKAILDRKREGEGIGRARARVLGERQAHEIGA